MKNQKLFLIFILIFLTILGKPAFSRRTDLSCLSNLRVIQGALEMYNMDHSKMIERYDSNAEDILIKEKYLKGKIYKPEPDKCEYKSIGDYSVNEDIFIFCTYHGDPNHLIYSEYYEWEEYEKLPQNATNEEIKSKIEYIKKEKEKYFEEVKRKKDLEKKKKEFKAKLILFSIPAIILFLIISNIPSRKRTS